AAACSRAISPRPMSPGAIANSSCAAPPWHRSPTEPKRSSRSIPPAACCWRRRSSHPARQELEYLLRIMRARLGVDRLYGRRECAQLVRRKFGNLATRRGDRGARLLVFGARQIALERHRRGDRFAHFLLQPRRPGVERRPVKENRPRDVKMIGDAMET